MSEGLDVILYAFLFLCIGVLCRQLVLGRGLSLPVNIFMVMAGALMGIAAKIIPVELDPLHLQDVSPETPFNIYMCILMFDCAFNTEVQNLKIIAYHMAIIAIPTMMLVYLLICTVGVLIFPYNLTARDYVEIVSVVVAPGPHMMKAYLTPTNLQLDLKTLLEAEAMFGNYVALTIFKISLTTVNYQAAVVYILTDLLVGSVVGFVVGKITIFWISKLFKDYVNQITIVLAFIYAGFAISYMIDSSGFLCVLTIGLVLSHRRSSMSTQFVQILTALLELIVFCMASFACVTAGVYLVTMIAENITIIDIAVTIAIFIIQNITRGLMLLFAFKYTAKHLETKTHVMILWACNIRGSYSLMMAFTLLAYDFRTHEGSKPFDLVLLQILLSFIMNSIICSFVIGYLNEDTLSKKKWMIERAARLMIAVRKSAVESLRNTMSIADADWNVVIKQTKLKSDFMSAYRYSSWVNKPMERRDSTSVMEDPGTEIREEAIRQINLSEKACYSRLYGEGMISRESVIQLMYLMKQCLKMKRLLKPGDIFQEVDTKSFLIRLEQQLAQTIENGPPNACIRLLWIAVSFIDINIIHYAIFSVIFDVNSRKLYYITAHNVIMFTTYCFVLLFCFIRNQSFQSETMWQSLYKIIVIVGFFDLLVTGAPVIYTDEASTFKPFSILNTEIYGGIFTIIVVICILTRFLRVLTVIQIMPLVQFHLLNLVMHMQDKKLFTECDMATGYNRVITETLRRMSSMVTDRMIANEFKYHSRKNKLETAQDLCLSQLQHPNVTAALKAKIAMRLTLNASERTLMEIKEMGLLEEKDSDLLHRDISKKMMAAQNFPYVINPSSVRSVLQNIPWIDGDPEVLSKVETAGHLIKFYTNDIIVSQGFLPGGVFVILHGVVRAESVRPQDYLQWNADKAPYFCNEILKSAQSDSSSGIKLQLHGFYTRGSVIGEMAFLIERPGHKTFRCATYVEVFCVSYPDLSEISERRSYRNDPLTTLEIKMWRAVSIRQAVRIIHNGGNNANVSRLSIFNRMSESYIVDGNVTPIFTVLPNEVSAVILIHGYVSQFYSELRYVGPCVLPYNQQKFTSHPELGPRVIYLVIKSTAMEENSLDGLVPEDALMTNYEDDLTITSGSSDVEPHRRQRDENLALENESDCVQRMLASGVSQSDMQKLEDYSNSISEQEEDTKEETCTCL